VLGGSRVVGGQEVHHQSGPYAQLSQHCPLPRLFTTLPLLG
jgi:hypothetical protein